MTISSATNKVSYSGNGSTTVFAYGFPITADADLDVYIRAATGTETLQTLTTHYTVSGAGGASGGNVTFGTAPVSGTTVVILRDIAATQSLDLVENDSFSAESLENSLDRLTMITSDIKEELTRSLKLSRTNTMTSTEFTTSSSDRASKVLSFDSSGELAVSQELGEFQGDWATSTAYVLRDIVKDTSNNNIYICNTAHTSSGSQPLSGNTDSAKWSLIVDAAAATTSASSASTSATAAATSATAAATSATAAAGSATSSAADAVSTAADAVSTAADVTSSGTNATNAATSATAAAASAASSSAAGLTYAYSTTTTDSDPGSGIIRFNNGTLSSATAAYMDDTDANSVDVSTHLLTWDDSSTTSNRGTLKMVKSGTPSTYALYTISGASTDASGYVKLALTHVASNGTFSNSDTVIIHNTRTGDTGSFSSGAVDLNGEKLTLDANANTSIHSDTDDQIDIEIAGADDFRFTPNTFSVLSGSTLTIDSGATIDASAGTATGFADFTAIADGSVGSPSLANAGDDDTGIYFPAADTVGVVTGGTEQFRFGSNPIPGGNKNLVLNPAMQIAQRGTSFTSYGATANEYSLDNWKISVGGSASARWTVSQESSGGVNGRSKWLKALNTTADTPGAAEGQAIFAPLEGNSIQALRRTGGGTKASTLSADVIVHADGGSSLSFPVTIAVALIINDGGNDRQIVTDISITSADTWQTIEFNAPADTSGNGPKNDNTRSGNVVFTLASGSNFNITADTWENNTNIPLNTSSTENLADATNNYIGFTNVQWEVGDVATDFAHEDVGTTLAKCYRYLEIIGKEATYTRLAVGYVVSATEAYGNIYYAPKRVAPTFTKSGTVYGNSFAGTVGGTLAVSWSSIQSAMLELSGGSSLTGGQAVSMATINGAGDYLIISSEL